MAKVEVQVVEGRGWSGGPYGSRGEGERFYYDIENDPHGLRELGLVRCVGKARKAPPGAAEGAGAGEA